MFRLIQFLLILTLAACAKKSQEETPTVITIQAPENLEELKWLVGNWTNSDDDSTFMTENHWDRYSNFLIQTFSLSVDGQDDFFGRQIIGWDPKEMRVRSWIFDSEGGFGHGDWYKNGDSWYVTVRYTLPNGSLASSTQIYTNVDNTRYQFSCTNRDIDGQILPNIGPFALIKDSE